MTYNIFTVKEQRNKIIPKWVVSQVHFSFSWFPCNQILSFPLLLELTFESNLLSNYDFSSIKLNEGQLKKKKKKTPAFESLVNKQLIILANNCIHKVSLPLG